MITHDELIFCIHQQYPDAVHGRDFWVGQNVCRDTGKQLEPACIIAWHVTNEEKPADEKVAALIEQHGAAARCHVLGQAMRNERDRRMKVADAMSYKAMDSGDTAKVQLAGQYRQALRDVPKLPGFPEAFEWPPVPEGLADSPSSNT